MFKAQVRFWKKADSNSSFIGNCWVVVSASDVEHLGTGIVKVLPNSEIEVRGAVFASTDGSVYTNFDNAPFIKAKTPEEKNTYGDPTFAATEELKKLTKDAANTWWDDDAVWTRNSFNVSLQMDDNGEISVEEKAIAAVARMQSAIKGADQLSKRAAEVKGTQGAAITKRQLAIAHAAGPHLPPVETPATTSEVPEDDLPF